MNTKQWVQHFSGQGEKWEILSDNCHESEWRVKARTHEYYHDLPKSEFILCDPPEEWEDVTQHLAVEDDGSLASEPDEKVWAVHCLHNMYRLRKVQLYKTLASGCHGAETCWAFIIERRKA